MANRVSGTSTGSDGIRRQTGSVVHQQDLTGSDGKQDQLYINRIRRDQTADRVSGTSAGSDGIRRQTGSVVHQQDLTGSGGRQGQRYISRI